MSKRYKVVKAFGLSSADLPKKSFSSRRAATIAVARVQADKGIVVPRLSITLPEIEEIESSGRKMSPKIVGYVLKNGNAVHRRHFEAAPKNIGELTGWPKGAICAICGGT